MANNGFISTDELDFQSYKSDLKAYLRGQSRFQDYDFEGSNLSTILDILSYNTYKNAFLLNMVGSEMFLDSATLRGTIVSHAKELNYVPRSRSSSRAVVDITLTPTNSSAVSFTIPKYFQFSTTIDGRTYIFSTDSSYVVRNTGTFAAKNVTLYEGRIAIEQFVATSSDSQSFVISSENIDISSLNVIVQNSSVDTDFEIYTRAYDLYGLDENSKKFFVQGYRDNQYEIVFGNGVIGKALTVGNIIQITYRDCSGNAADGASRFNAANSIDGVNSLSISTITNSYAGAERETIDSIRYNAPRHFSTQNRAVTKDDYTTLIKSNFPEIQSVNVFGGEELEQKKYGKIIIVAKPYGGNIVSNSTKSKILAFIKDRIALTISPIIQDADYFNLKINCNILYDPAITNINQFGVETLVRSAISNYNALYLDDFGSDFRYSKLISSIDSADASILGNQTDVFLVKKITPTVNYKHSEIIYFNNEIYRENITSRLPIGHTVSITSSVFVYTKNSTNYNAYIADDGLGTLYIYTSDNNESRTILQDNIGSVDYITGKVSITNLITTSYRNQIDIICKTKNKDIDITQTQILNIDSNDVSITVIEN